MVLSWSLVAGGHQGARASSQAKFDFRLDEQDWEKVCWGRLPKGEARSLSHQLSRRAKWAAVLRQAAQPEGGGWREDFAPSDMTPGRLQALARVIDHEFFQGTFHRTIARKTGRRVSYIAADVGDSHGYVQTLGDAVMASSAPSRRRRRCGLAPLAVVRPAPPPPALPPQVPDGGAAAAAAAAAAAQPDGVGGGPGRRWWLRGLSRRGGSRCGTGGFEGAGGSCGEGSKAGSGGGGASGLLGPSVPQVLGPSATYMHSRGRVVFWRQVWGAHAPSLGHPVRLDGVPCPSRLSWLAHTIGHEMLHILLFSMCNDHARDAPHNMSLEGHGYNFLMLNWYVLGHRGHVYSTKGWRPPRPVPCRL